MDLRHYVAEIIDLDGKSYEMDVEIEPDKLPEYIRRLAFKGLSVSGISPKITRKDSR